MRSRVEFWLDVGYFSLLYFQCLFHNHVLSSNKETDRFYRTILDMFVALAALLRCSYVEHHSCDTTFLYTRSKFLPSWPLTCSNSKLILKQ